MSTDPDSVDSLPRNYGRFAQNFGLSTRAQVREALLSGRFVPTKCRNCGRLCLETYLAWAKVSEWQLPSRQVRRLFVEGMIQGLRDAANECEQRKSSLKQPAYNTACDECGIFIAALAERLQLKLAERPAKGYESRRGRGGQW